MTCKNEVSLSQEISKNITFRILCCVFFLGAILLVNLYYNYYSVANHIRAENAQIADELTPYIISQELISNRYSIPIKINELEKKYKINIHWHVNQSQNKHGLYFSTLVDWGYFINIKSVDNHNFGYYKISGSLLKDKSFISVLWVMGIFTLVFLLLIIIVLYPIASYIPKRIIIKPVEELLELLNSREPGNHLTVDGPKEIRILKRSIVQMIEKESSFLRKEHAYQLAKQVAHDIRSPLAALEMMTKHLEALPDHKKKVIQNATKQIGDIANNLLQQNQTTQQPTTLLPCRVSTLLGYIESAKRAEWSSIDQPSIDFSVAIDDRSHAIFMMANASEFARILSNLCNNALEALGEVVNPCIQIVTRFVDNHHVIVEVIDNGCGMTEQQLKHVFEEGVSYKSEGHGLGLFHAKQQLELILCPEMGLQKIEQENQNGKISNIQRGI